MTSFGPTRACAASSAESASLTPASAALRAVIVSARPWKTWTSDAAVYTVPPIVNDPFGKCFVVPAMIACTRAKAAALVLVDVFVVLDMYGSLLSEGGANATRRAPRSRSAPRGPRAVFAALIWTHSRGAPIPRGRGG